MVKHDYILFDLDGTISKSADGIKYSLENAIKQMGKPVPDLSDYTLYIGPPLIDTFLNICHFSQEESLRGVEVYRDIYNTEGKFVNKAYDGIEELLKKIKADGKKIAVCSSKYELFAKEIIEILGLSQYFDAVCGSTLDGSRKDKKDLIPYALNSLGTSLEKDRENAVIIGDTYFDTKGAVQTGIDFVGASYGYGDIEQMKKAVEEGVDCRGYLSWGPIDILSSRAQMKKRYGFVYVNRDNDDLKDMRRIKKKSFEWYKNVISSNGEVL